MEVLNNIFKLKENQTTVGTEVRAGLTTFLAMAYIILVNPVFLSATGMDSNGVMIATCLSAAIGTLLCAFLNNKPFALAPGMGMNAFFAYTLCFGYGFTWQQALALVFLSGIIFLLMVLLVGEKVVNLIPLNLKVALTVGIGFLLVLIGLLDGGFVSVASGVPAFGDLSDPMLLIAIAGVLVTMVLCVRNVKGSFLIGIFLTIILSIICKQGTLPDKLFLFPSDLSKVFLKLDFTGLISAERSVVDVIAILISMAIVDMFDTVGYLVGTAANAGMLDEKGEVQGMKKLMAADAGATIMGSLCGTSTVTTFAESTSGITAGGRTGLTAVITAILFLAAMFFSPIAGLANSAVTSPALIIVGMYLMMEVRKLELESLADVFPALLTIIAIPMTYSITTGIAIGFLTYVICEIAAGRGRKIKVGNMILTLVFLLYFMI